MGSYRTTSKSGKYKQQEPPIKTKLTLNLSTTDGKIESVHLKINLHISCSTISYHSSCNDNRERRLKG